MKLGQWKTPCSARSETCIILNVLSIEAYNPLVFVSRTKNDEKIKW